MEKEPFGLEGETWLQINGYNYNGFVASFLINLKFMDIKKPVHTLDEVNNVLNQYSDDVIVEKKELPNILVIMNESFSDLKNIADFETDEEYMPFISSLNDNVVKGKVYVSIFGGNTANSEFEFLTGFTSAFLPEGSVAYQSYYSEKVKEKSFTDYLKLIGYNNTYAFHPYNASGWNRDKIYQLMNFDRFYSLNDYNNIDLIRNLVSDSTNYKMIENIIGNNLGQIFAFNVTIQNHGGYEYRNYKNTVNLVNMKKYPDVEQYLSLIKESNKAFEELVDYYTGKSPTVILMFGDHYPSLSTDFYEDLYNKSLEDLSLEETQKRYSIPFVMWANYDIEEEFVDGISLNYLSSWMLRKLGLPMNSFQKYLFDLNQSIPVINSIGYMDKNGEFHSFDEKNNNTEKIEEYRAIQYYKLLKGY